MKSENLIPVILCGGSGTRLWPVSRQLFPKQFMPTTDGNAFLEVTLARLEGLADLGRITLVTNEEHRFLVAEMVRRAKLAADIFIEPVGRNTAPAIGLAAIHALAANPEAVLLVLPSDHLIADCAAFHAAVEAAMPAVREGGLATFGIVPAHAETGYGYIRRGERAAEIFKVAKFVEKPDAATAAKYLASGEYYWNSGMFLFRADVYLAELERHSADISGAVQQSAAACQPDLDFIRPGREAFEACRADSIDYAVMEKTERAVVVPLDAGWSDIGSWASLAEVSEADEQGNVLRGDVLAVDTENSLLYSQGRLLATLGVKDHIVVETADAVLVAAKGRAQDVKQIVNLLKQQGRREAVEHRRVYRPWGYYESIMEGPFFQVKKLCVKPKAGLSLQMHYHRAEHWVVVVGTAKVTNGEGEFLLSENESTYIPKGHKHRLENPGKVSLEVIEIQTGAYLGEDDIVRFDDTYGRIEE